MTLLKRARISTKIFGGFGIVLLLLATIALVGVLEFDKAKNSFVDYRSLARQSNQLGRIQANLLEARLHVKRFIINQSEDSVDGVKERATRALGFIRDGEKLARESEYLNRIGLSEKLSQILMKEGENITRYLKAFDDVLELQAKRNQIVHQELDVIGVEMERALSGTLKHAHDTSVPEATFWAGVSMRNLLLMRLYTAKFLIQNDRPSFDRAIAESRNFTNTLDQVSRYIEHAEFVELVRKIKEWSKAYIAAIKAVQSTIDSRNAIISDQLEVIGPDVARAVEDVKLELLKEQDTLGPSAEEALADAEIIIFIVCILSLLIGTAAAFFIGRSISKPVVAMTAAFNALASGDKSAEIPGRDHVDEIGDMAKAAQVFKEKTIEAEELSLQVMDRTAELEQKTHELHTTNTALEEELKLRKSIELQLVHTQKLESLGTLAGGIAHDFNNMLFVIISGSQTALHSLRNGESDIIPTIERIEAAAQRSRSIVHQILSFGRQDSYDDLEEVDMADVAQEALTLLRAGVLSSIDLKANIEESRLPILGDVSRIQQVIINLVNNAYFACSANNGKITVDLAKVNISSEDSEKYYSLASGSYVRLRVADSGTGIPREDLPKIFDPFFTTKSVGEGTGLGLSVVHGTVAAHDGAILCDSELGVGTTFDVYFPAHDKTNHEAIT